MIRAERYEIPQGLPKQLLHLAPERMLGATLQDQLCRFAPGKFATPLKSGGKKGDHPRGR